MTVRRSRSRIHKTNAIVYFDEILDEQLRQHIKSIVGRVEGVTDVHFNETQHQLMIVDFDPKRTDTDVILSRVKRRHLHAQLL